MFNDHFPGKPGVTTFILQLLLTCTFLGHVKNFIILWLLQLYGSCQMLRGMLAALLEAVL